MRLGARMHKAENCRCEERMETNYTVAGRSTDRISSYARTQIHNRSTRATACSLTSLPCRFEQPLPTRRRGLYLVTLLLGWPDTVKSSRKRVENEEIADEAVSEAGEGEGKGGQKITEKGQSWTVAAQFGHNFLCSDKIICI